MYNVFICKDRPPSEKFIPPKGLILFKDVFVTDRGDLKKDDISEPVKSKEIIAQKAYSCEKDAVPKEYYASVIDDSAPGRRWRNIKGNIVNLRIMRFFVYYKNYGMDGSRMIMTVDDLQKFRNLPKEVRKKIIAPLKNRSPHVTLEL